MVANRNPTLRAQWLGQQLREMREAAGMTLNDAGAYLQRNSATVSRFESAEYPIRRPDVLALLDLYGVSEGKQREALLQLGEAVWKKGWWDGYTEHIAGSLIDLGWLESRAEEIRSFDGLVLPGLLQTREYAEATIKAGDPTAPTDQIERWLEFRMKRKQVLATDQPPHVAAVLDEALLRRPVGGAEVMRAQLAHLAEITERPGIEIRVLPFSAGAHASHDGSFRLIKLSNPHAEVAHMDTPSGALYVESDGIERFTQTYDRLCREALPPEKSAALLAAATEDMR